MKNINNDWVDAFRSILISQGGTIFTDLDDTVKENHKVLWSNGKQYKVYPETIAAFMTLSGLKIPLTPVTEQSLLEFVVWKNEVEELAQNQNIFTGMIAEGGCIAVRGTGKRIHTPAIIASKEAVDESRKILKWLENNLEPTKGDWKILPGTNPMESTYVMLPSLIDQGLATVSLWKQGPHISENPKFILKYDLIDQCLNQIMNKLGITHLIAREAGNGTSRIMPRYITKAKTVGLLATTKAFDISRCAYFCDGPNDIGLAEKIKSKNGFVFTVSNAITQLKNLSDYTATEKAGKGFAQIIELLFPNEFLNSLNNLRDRGLYI